MKTVMARLGYFPTQHFIPRRFALTPEERKDSQELKRFLEQDPTKILVIEDVKQQSDDGELKVLAYKVKVGIGLSTQSLEVKLKYEPKANLPRWRETIIPLGDAGPMILTEVYHDFKLGDVIADSEFMLPGK